VATAVEFSYWMFTVLRDIDMRADISRFQLTTPLVWGTTPSAV